MNRDKVSLGRKQCKNTLTSEVTSLSPLKMTCLLCEQLPLQILEILLSLLRKRNIFYLVVQLKAHTRRSTMLGLLFLSVFTAWNTSTAL